MTRRAMSGHHSASPQTTIWLTPPEIIAGSGGWESFDLDPCAPYKTPIRTAKRQYSYVFTDGFKAPWFGRVYLNPPYTNAELARWLRRLADHGTGTAFIFARTETAAFFSQVWRRAAGVLFLDGRVHFHYPDGRRAPANAGAPSVLCAYGQEDLDRLAAASDGAIPGQFVPLRFPRSVVVANAPASWREVVMSVVREVDGPVAVADLYKALARHPKIAANNNWRAKIRQTLQRGPFKAVSRGQWEAAA